MVITLDETSVRPIVPVLCSGSNH